MLSDEQLAYTEEKGFAGPSAVSALVNEIRELRAQREAVLALHREKVTPISASSLGDLTYTSGCGYDGFAWPCATVRAMGVTE